MFRRLGFFPALSVALSLAACGVPASDDATTTPPPEDVESEDDVELAGDTAEALTLLEFLNDTGTTFEILDEQVGLDSRAAENLIAHRDGADLLAGTGDDDYFDTMDEVDAISWVGPVAVETLTQYVTAQGWVYYSTGTFEGVVFNTSQVTLALDLVNYASFLTLDVDASLDSRAAENIIAARPIISMRQLSEIAYVGPSALERIRAHLPTWQLQGVTLESYDGVTFTHAEAAGALSAANTATQAQLLAAGITGAQDDLIFSKRPWSSLSLVTSTAGIGPLTTMRLKLLSASFPAPVYSVTSADAVEFADIAEGALRDDEGFGGEMLLLIEDVTGSTAYTDAVLAEILDAISARVHAFATTEIGRGYSSRDAAFDAVYQHGRGLFFTARTAYPEGVLSFVEAKTTAEKLARGKEGILAYWQHEFVHTPEWIDVFSGKSWNDVKSQVGADVSNFENTSAYEVYQQTHQTIFVGSVYGLYTETTVDDVGKVVRVYVEID